MAVEVRIETAPEYRNDAPVEIIFEIFNNTNQDIKVLKWKTPLEGLRSDCLNVTVNGHPVKYDGFMVKRGKPDDEDYVYIKAGASVSTKVNLDEAYDVSEQGEYKVTFDVHKLEIIVVGGGDPSLLSDANTSAALEVAPVPTDFHVQAGAEPRRTIGERMRAEAKKKEIGGLMAEALPSLLEPQFKGTGRQRRSVKTAHKNGYDYAAVGIRNTGDNDDYIEWFGNHTPIREERVRSHFEQVKEGMENTVFTYDLTGHECGSKDYAYTTIGADKVWICPMFWQAPSKGVASKAGTILHEHTHASAGTDDLEYGEEDCRQLAIDSPAGAIHNADNHEFFVEKTA